MTRVLALHGFTGASASYDELRAQLPDGIGWLTPMLAGHGLEPTPAVSFDAEVERLAAYCDGDDPLFLVGYSLGGRLALGLLERLPGRFVGALSISAHPGLVDASARAERAASDDALAARLREEGLEPFLERWEAGPLFATQRDLPERVRAFRRAIRRTHRADALADALSRLSLGRMPDFRAAIARRTTPLEFVAGSLDEKFTALAHECAKLAGSTAILAEGAGHDVLLERPAFIAERIRRRLEAIE